MDDIKTKKDIAHLVTSFYSEIQNDKLIGPIFDQIIKGDQWPQHLEKMTRFWHTVLLGAQDYRGNPFSHHIKLDIDKDHFDRWIMLFNKVIHANFDGPKAQEAIQRADKMRIMFESKLNHIREHPNQYPIL